MPTLVDARGKACPQPVIMARRALAQDADVTVIVDNETARGNVQGMARSQGHAVAVEERADGIYLHIRAVAPAAAPQPAAAAGGPNVILIAGDRIGRGPEELGAVLMRSLMHTLTEVSPLPEVIILVNEGVRLAVEGSPVLDDLRTLAGRGVQILACGTCLGFFELKDRVAVGTVSNMYTIAETLLAAGKVVSM